MMMGYGMGYGMGGPMMAVDPFTGMAYIPKSNKKARSTRRKEVLKKSGVKESNVHSDQKWDVMLSYQWDNQKNVKLIKKHLETKGLKVWMDVSEMRGGINDKMAEAIAFSKIIIICLSSKYEESKNCTKEYTYADACDREIIPVKMESKFTAKRGTALSMIMGDKLYYDLEKNFQQGLSQLSSAVIKTIKELNAEKKKAKELKAEKKKQIK